MIPFTLTYRKYGIRRKVSGQIPGSWNDLTERQYLAAVDVMTGKVNDRNFISGMFMIPESISGALDPWYEYVLAGKLSFLKNRKPMASHFFIRRIGRLYAPEDELQGVSLQQFMTVDTFFERFARVYEEEKMQYDILDSMIGALYLRKDQTYFLEDNRHRLVDIEKNAVEAGKYGIPERMGVFLNWVMIRAWLSRAYPSLFPESVEKEKRSDSKKKKNNWLAVFDAFVDDHIADMEKYQKMECTDAFRVMNRRIINYKKSKIR
jgi:hypothetical protein